MERSFQVIKNVESKKIDISKIKSERYFIFTQDAGYAVYTGRFVLKLKGNFSFNKEKNFEKLMQQHSYTEIVNFFNFSVPEKISEYYFSDKVPEYIDKESIEIPTIYSQGVKYVDSTKLNMLFVALFYKILPTKTEQKKITTVDIINATSNENYIKNFKDKFLTKNYSCSYSNYGEIKNKSYVYNNGTTIEKMREFVMAIDEKYIKTAEEPPFATESEIIFIAGEEDEPEVKIAVYGDKKNIKKMEKRLKELKYSKIEKRVEKAVKTVIKYNKEDYFTAYKLSELTGIKAMEEENTLENMIEIYLSREAKE